MIFVFQDIMVIQIVNHVTVAPLDPHPQPVILPENAHVCTILQERLASNAVLAITNILNA